MRQVEALSMEEKTKLRNLKNRLYNLMTIVTQQEKKKETLLEEKMQYDEAHREIEESILEKKNKIKNTHSEVEEVGLGFSLFGQLFHMITKTNPSDTSVVKACKIVGKGCAFLFGTVAFIQIMSTSLLLFGIGSISLAIGVNSLELHAKDNRKKGVKILSGLKETIERLSDEVSSLEREKQEVEKKEFLLSKEVRNIDQSLIVTNQHIQSLTREIDGIYLENDKPKEEANKVYHR